MGVHRHGVWGNANKKYIRENIVSTFIHNNKHMHILLRVMVGITLLHVCPTVAESGWTLSNNVVVLQEGLVKDAIDTLDKYQVGKDRITTLVRSRRSVLLWPKSIGSGEAITAGLAIHLRYEGEASPARAIVSNPLSNLFRDGCPPAVPPVQLIDDHGRKVLLKRQQVYGCTLHRIPEKNVIRAVCTTTRKTLVELSGQVRREVLTVEVEAPIERKLPVTIRQTCEPRDVLGVISPGEFAVCGRFATDRLPAEMAAETYRW